MKKLMIASLGLSLLTGTAMFAQNTSGNTSTETSTMKKKGKKGKKGKTTEGSSTASSNTGK